MNDGQQKYTGANQEPTPNNEVELVRSSKYVIK